MIMNYSL